MPVTANGITQLLEQELAAARALQAILEEEQRCLISTHIDELVSVTERKTALIAQVSGVSALRIEAFNAQGIEAGPSVQAYLLAISPVTLQIWKELMAVAAEAKELNSTNGLLIARQMTNGETALHILRGSASTGHFYGPDGQSMATRTGRSFAAG